MAKKRRTWVVVVNQGEPFTYLVRMTDAEADSIIGTMSRMMESGKIRAFDAAPADKTGMNVGSFRRQVLGMLIV